MAELVSDSWTCCGEGNNRRLENAYKGTKTFCVLFIFWKFQKRKKSNFFYNKTFQQENFLDFKFKLRFIAQNSTHTFSLFWSCSFHAPFSNPKWGNWSNAFCTYHWAHRFRLPAAVLTSQIHRPPPILRSGVAFLTRGILQAHPPLSAYLTFASLSSNHWHHSSAESDSWIKKNSLSY